jgi:hypothetical protein
MEVIIRHINTVGRTVGSFFATMRSAKSTRQYRYESLVTYPSRIMRGICMPFRSSFKKPGSFVTFGSRALRPWFLISTVAFNFCRRYLNFEAHMAPCILRIGRMRLRIIKIIVIQFYVLILSYTVKTEHVIIIFKTYSISLM